MSIPHQAKWFGLSAALHLAAAAGFSAVALHDVQRSPKAIVVVLENLDLPEMPQRKVIQTTARPVVRPVLKSKPERVVVMQKPNQQIQQSVIPLGVVSKTVPVQSSTREMQPVSSDLPVVAVMRQVSQISKKAGDTRLSTEKAQQRYLKEHFRYISDLIAKRLVYPPMARRMNWSGRVVVSFTIAEDGTVHGLKVISSSGHSILDKSALETVRSAAPFPRPPVRAEIEVPINFSMVQ